jgi:hypothetical protein
LCCVVPGPVGPSEPQCIEPNDRGTCPLGCRSCRCASPETPIATPDGERALEDLRVGDLVYSVDDLAIVAVPILAVHRQPAQGHAVPRVVLDDGRTLEVSAGHPTADGRTFGDLAPGDRLGERTVERIVYAAYRHPFTYDIRPDSSTGTYFAAGALVASTLVRSDSGRARPSAVSQPGDAAAPVFTGAVLEAGSHPRASEAGSR